MPPLAYGGLFSSLNYRQFSESGFSMNRIPDIFGKPRLRLAYVCILSDLPLISVLIRFRFCITLRYSVFKVHGGLEWTRTTGLTLIRRAL